MDNFIILKSIGMLCIVIGILLGFLYLIRKLSHEHLGRHPIIKIVANSYVSPKERVVLLDVLGEKILIGITSQNINFLAKIEKEIPEETAINTHSYGFTEILKKALTKKNG
ncbi:MAG: flagellar biosynthetic protein FliO [Desulfobacterales bacterium]|nr:flagellar biosynthetic protein FliO [Desulfobacterales bacterium]